VGQIEKDVILRIPADNRTRLDLLDRLAIGKIVAQQFQSPIMLQAELRIRQDAREFGGGSP
jgi:hypothetical protein